MKMTFKKFMCAVLAVVLVFGVTPLAALNGVKIPSSFSLKANATEDYTELSVDKITYTIENSSVTITGCDNAVSGNIKIPETIEGYRVKRIGTMAFADCVNITGIDLGKTESMGVRVFSGCTNMTFLKAPNTLLSADSNYSNAGSLTDSNFEIIEFEEGTETIFSYFCYGLKSLEKIIIYDDLKTISEYAFTNCSNLATTNENDCIKLSSSIKNIDSMAFAGCDSIISVEMGDSIRSVGSGAFSYCGNLQSVNIHNPESKGNRTLYFGSKIFANTPNLTEFTVPCFFNDSGFDWTNSKGTFADSSVEKLVFEEGITKIPSYVCSKCTSLKEVIIPESVESIAGDAFRSCSNLVSDEENMIEFPKNLKTIGSTAFVGCTTIKNIAIHGNIEKIGQHAFSGCSNLSSFEIMDDKTNPNAKLEFGAYMLNGTKVKSLIIPNNFNSCVFYVDLGSKGVISGSNVEKLIFAAGINVIPVYSFCHSPCLKEVYIPITVSKIESEAFASCPEITDVYYEGTQAQWEDITIYSYNGNLTNATIHYLYNHVHEYTESLTKQNTCTDAGEKTFTCVCGDNYTEIIPAIGGNHKYDDGKVIAEPTETTPGRTVYTCEICSETYETYPVKYTVSLENDDNAVIAEYNNKSFLEDLSDEDDDVILNAELIEKKDQTDIEENLQINQGFDCILGYRINVIDKNGNIIDKPVDGTKVKVRVKIPDGVTQPERLKVYHWKDRDTGLNAQTLYEVFSFNDEVNKFTIENGYLVFVIDHFSEFIIAEPVNGDIPEIKTPTVAIKNNSGSINIKYRESVTLTADVNYLPDDAKIVWFVNGVQKGEGEKFTLQEAKEDSVVTVKIFGSDGREISQPDANAELKVNVNGSFFAKLIAFILGLFGMLKNHII